MVVAESVDARERLLTPWHGVLRGYFGPLHRGALEVDSGPMVKQISCRKWFYERRQRPLWAPCGGRVGRGGGRESRRTEPRALGVAGAALRAAPGLAGTATEPWCEE